jgi:hypothetical protein
MMRRTDWPERMALALAAAEVMRFVESYSCVCFAADVVLAMTDVDPLPVRHESVVDAYKYMRSVEGFETIEAAIEAKVGPSVPLAFARRGDLILRRVDGQEAIGICCGQESAFISSQGGLAFWPTLSQSAAFRV